MTALKLVVPDEGESCVDIPDDTRRRSAPVALPNSSPIKRYDQALIPMHSTSRDENKYYCRAQLSYPLYRSLLFSAMKFYPPRPSGDIHYQVPSWGGQRYELGEVFLFPEAVAPPILRDST